MTRFNVMGSLRTSVICVLFFSSVVYTLSSGVQKPGLVQSSLAKERQNEVKKVFASAYADYMKFGFPFDEVRPVAKRGQNTRNGWSATLVDSLDTLFIMGLKNEFDQGVSHTLKIDFSKSQTNDSVSLFETTIRYLGGMLSAYELSGSKNTALLKQARTLGDKLLTAWPDPRQNLPFPQLDFGRNRPVFKKKISSAEILIAEAGTLILELGRLSHHTQNPKYLRQAVKAMQAIMNSRSTFPGLAGFSLAVQSQAVKNDFATWGGGAEWRFDPKKGQNPADRPCISD
ncbi:maturation of Asn-linked oligosaccharides protein [Puccinia graminis f. sp. tritici]|uniref:alpha-1,2-Mannosidase n=1 Tax=Puccinia graminis f. sp. tritici TaxID=56615 RepID=A0A5B0MZ67_PUCGR|nr:maturation of Asn-linked oligosaccharides protein [Puccinia graminis f. sp. tritici]